VTFFSFCCSEETTVGNDAKYNPNIHLSYSDVAIDDTTTPLIVSLFIKRSKTDQERVGAKVVIGRTGDDLFPVLALLDYLRQVPLELCSCGRTGHLYHNPATCQALTAANLPSLGIVTELGHWH